MRKHKRRPQPARHARFVRLIGLEQLEDRILLNAPNAFAQFNGQLLHPGDTEQIPIALTSSNFYVPPSGVVLGFQAQTGSGSALDPAAVKITNAAGATVTPRYSNPDLAGNKQSVVLAALPVGNYTITMQGDRNTTGSFQLNVFLAGDVDGDHTVTTTDGKTIVSLLGSTAGDGKYQVAADSNLDGIINAFDYTQWRANVGASTPLRTLGITESLPNGLYLLPDGTPVTASSTIPVSGTTGAGATVALETGNDSNFDEGQTTADGTGNYSLTAPLVPGSNTLQVRANDSFGQQAFASVKVSLDTQAPVVTFTSPTSPLRTNTNVTLTGQVTDNLSGTASLEASVDNGAYQPISFDAQGHFSFATALALDGSADGQHTVRLQATDHVGNISSPFDYSFTLDTVAPVVSVSSPSSGLTFRTNPTLTGQVTDAVSGVASLQAAVDNGAYQTVSFDTQGDFTFPTSLLLDGSADGPHTVYLRATDKAGNVSTPVAFTFTLDTIPPVVSISSPSAGLSFDTDPTLTGKVTDNLSGTASLQASVDNGAYQTVSFDAQGNFAFTTALVLNGSTDGSHTVRLRATDQAGNVSTPLAYSFTLDTVAPSISVSAPSPVTGLVTKQNVAIAGQVMDALSGVASLQAAQDGGNFSSVSLGSGGSFSLTTALPLDGSTDGSHIEHLKATDNAGNVSFVDVSFTLDTIPPVVDFHLDPASDTAPVGDGHTTQAVVTLDGTTEPNTSVVLLETGARTTSDTSGAFSFSGVALALGDNTFTVQATDPVGNTGTAQHTITRDSAFGNTLVEETRFVTPLDQTFIVPSNPSILEFKFGNLSFDTSANFIKDAFEASLTDANGNSLVLPIAGSRDAFLNITEGQSPVLSPNVQLNGDTADLDLSHIAAGTQAHLQVRLVNNDSDTTTSVEVDNAQVIAGTMNTPIAVTPAAAAAASTSSVDFSALSDVTTSMTVTYGQTSLNKQSNVLYANMSLSNSGSYPVDAPLIAVVEHLSDPSIRVRNSDGTTPEGLPYFILSGSLSGNTLAVGQATGTRTLAFSDPNGVQFTYDLKILGHLNRPPAFTSEPNTESISGTPYVYQAAASDPDKDSLAFSLKIGPTGMSVDASSGKVTWNPQSGDLGNETVLLQVDDGHGGSAQQQYTVSTINAPPDRPPLFTSTPVIDGNVDTAYHYQATATDPDNDPLTFSLTTGPVGMSVNANTGLVSWTPTVNQLGTVNVTLTVADGRGGTATQSYTVNVAQTSNNGPPRITSDPVTQYNIPPASNPPAGAVSPGSINLTLGNGQTSNQTVSLTGLSGGPITLGSLVTGNFGTPGQKDVYTFTLSSNALLYFDSLTTTATGFAIGNDSSFQWSLTGPNTNISRRFSASDGSSSSNPVLGLAAGDYTLTVVANDQTTGPYSFRLSDLDTATSLTPGTPVSDTLDPGTSTKLYKFKAVAGQSYYFASLAENGSIFADSWRLIDPYGNELFRQVPGAGGPFAQQDESYLVNDGGRIKLAVTGTYTLLIEGFTAETGPVSYTINAEPIADTTQPLTLGNTVNGNLTPGQQDSYTFNLSSNSHLYFDSLTANVNFQWSLSGPAGTVVSNRPFTGSDGQGIQNPVLALPAGNYVLSVAATGKTAGNYSFRLSDLAAATPLTPGTPVSDTFNPSISTDLYQFNAAAGQSFYFAKLAQSGGTFNNDWRLIDPYGNVVFNSFLGNDAGRVTLTAGGTYTLLVEADISDTGTVSYTVNVAPITDTTQTLTLGNTVNATLAAPSQQDRYTFNLAASSLLYFDALTNNAGLQWSLTGPGGTAVSNRSFTATDGRSIGTNPVLALPAGAYTLTISGSGQTAGAYSFRLLDLSTATTLPLNTAVNGTFNPANSTNLYKFTANAGDTYQLSAQGGTAVQYMRLIDPFGNVVVGNVLGNTFAPVTLLATGTYYLAVEGFISDTGTANYTIKAQFQGNVPPPPPSGTALTLGITANGNLTVSGQQDHYFFTLPANALLYFDALTNNGNLAWSLSGPGGVVVTNRQFPSSDYGNSLLQTNGISTTNPVLPLPAGTYSLTVIALFGSIGGAYSFRLSDLASATALTPGNAVSGTLNPGNSSTFYKFNASAGQSVYFAQQSGSSSIWWLLIDPYGNMLFSTFFNTDSGRLTLGASGTYTLLLEGRPDNTSTVNYSFNVAPITDKTQSLTLGGPVSGALAAPGEQDRYTFNLTANALLYFDSLTNSGNIQWSLTGPTGTVVSNRQFNNSDALANFNDVLSLPPGSYTLLVNGSGSTTGAYAFRLADLASATPLTPGTAVHGTLNSANGTDLYQFSAAAGQSFYFAGNGGTSVTRWRLVDPYGNVLFRDISEPLANDYGRLTLTASGTYTILVEGLITDTVAASYSFNVIPITDKTQTLTLGNLVNGTLAAPTEQDRYTFHLATSTQVDFDSLTNNAGFVWSLSGPTSTAVSGPAIVGVNNRTFSASDGNNAIPVLALPPGDYTLTVTGTGQTTGAYSFRLSDLTTATLLTPGTPVSGTLSPANSTNIYQFNAAAGQSFYFAHLSGGAGTGAIWRLLDPNGKVLFSPPGGPTPLSTDAGRLTLSAGGTYTLLVEGAIGDTGTTNYSFNVDPITDTTQALTPGSLVNGSLASPGVHDTYTFHLAANSQLDFDSLTNSNNFLWSLTGPTGTVVSNRLFSVSDGNSVIPVLALPPGDYTLTVTGSGQTTGAYSFRLSDLTTATPLTPGTPVSGTLSPANSTNIYQFNAVAGQSFYFAHLSSSGGPNAIWRLIDPNGKVLFSPPGGPTPLSNDAGRLTLSAGGTYTLLVEGAIGDTGTTTYSFNVAPTTDKSQSLTLGSQVNGSLASPGEHDAYTFRLAANSQLYFDSLTNSGNFLWSLTGPTGTPVNNRQFSVSDGNISFFTNGNNTNNPLLPLPPGDYTLTVTGSGQTTGAYSFRLSDLVTASATPLTPGTPVSGTLNPANSTNIYQFHVNAGDQYTFTPQGSSGLPSATWRLIDPYGNLLFTASLGTSEGPLSLTATGNYSILIEGGIANTGSGTYNFNVQFQGNTPPTFSGTPLTLGSPVNGSLTTAGQQDKYIFTLAANAQLYFDSLTNNSNLVWSLSGPGGTAVSNRSFAGSDAGFVSNPVLTLPAGNYTLTVAGTGSTTGAYSFNLFDLATAAPLTTGTAVNGSLSPTNSTNSYHFNASAGQSFYFARLSGSGGSFNDRWTLIDPFGNIVFSTFLSSDAGRRTLSVTGTYTLLVEGFISDTGTESYSFNVAPIADVAQTLPLGSTVNGTLAAPGQQDRYTFNLSTSSQLYFDSLTNSNNIQWSLIGPAGTVISNRVFSGSDGLALSNPVLALTAGAYTLTVSAPGQVTGAYSFRLSDLSTATPFAINTPVGSKLSPGNSTNFYQLNAQAGDSYYFESQKLPFALGTSSNSTQWRLVDPYGHILFSVNLGTDGGRITLPVSGTYTLLVEGAIQNTGTMGYIFRVDQPQIEVVSSDPNAPFVNQTGAVDDLNAATFNVQLAGNGQAQGYDLQFVSPATGLQLGSIPVAIDTQYVYQVRSVDPDGDPLTYQLVQAPTGMQIDPSTGLITWIPTAAQVGANSVIVRVEDDHGGVDTQTFVVNVTSVSPGGIQGAVFDDQDGDGNRTAVPGSPPPAGGPFQPAGSPFPSIGLDSGPAMIITIGADGAITVTTTGKPPYDGSDDTYVGVINQANSGVAVQALELSSDADIFSFDNDGIGSAGATGYEGPGVYFSDYFVVGSIDDEGNPARLSGKVNFDDGTGNGLQPGQQTYFALEDIPTIVVGTIVKQEAPAAVEPGLDGWTVYLDLNHNGQLDPSEPTSQTDALGHYSFSNLAPGTYTVAEVGKAGWLQTAPAAGTSTATVLSGQVTGGIDFGNQQMATVVPRPPVITSTAPTTAAAGQTYRYAVTVRNPDGDVLDFDLPVKPDGMVVDQQTGLIVWEPTDHQVGTQNVVLRLRDNQGDVIQQSFQIAVGLESAPVITSTPPQQPAESSLPWQYQVQAQDAENDPLTYSLPLAPTGMTIDPKTGLISWIGAQVGPGLPSGYQVTVKVDDGRGGTDSQTFTVNVISPGFDRPPAITSHPRKDIDFSKTTFFYQVEATDPDGDPLTYSLPIAPAGMTISSTGLLHWLPTQSDVGVHPVEIEVDDGRGLKATQDFTMTITWQITNSAPIITSVPPESDRDGLLYEYDATADDLDGDPVIWSLDTAPAGMSINADTGAIRWTPTLDQLGSANVVVRASDTQGGFSTQSFTITVHSGNTPPNITSKPPTQATVGQLYNYAVKAVDPDGDPMTYSLVAAPDGMGIDASTGVVQWAPTAAQVGPQQVIIRVDDGHGGAVLQGYSIVVSSTAGNQPPAFTSTPGLTSTVNQAYTYQATASDPEGDALHFSLLSAPTGMTIDAVSGLVQWTPDISQLGGNPVLLAVTDTAGNVATQNFTLTALAPNRPPVINSTPVTKVTAGESYSYDVVAVDPDNDPLTYSLGSAPAGMTIDSLGRITWSPQIADIGNQPVQVTVSDGRGGTVSQPFTVIVAADTEAPEVDMTLSDNPADLGTSVIVTLNATDNVGVTGLTLTENGVPVALDAQGTAIIAASAVGNFTLLATASDAAGNTATATQTLVVLDPHVTNAPIVDLTSPADDATVTAPTDVIGTVQDPNLVSYTLAVAPLGSDNFTTFFTGTTQVNNGKLGTFDPTMLQNDSYDLRLTATNTGGLSSTVDTTVNVSQHLKLGNFTLTFTDLSIPVSGVPITVTRTYDTMNANELEDFGYGWRLDFRDTDLRTSVGLTGHEADLDLFKPFKEGTKVYLTLPGGQREGFTFEPKLQDGLRGSFLGLFEPNFVPDPGVTDSLTVDPADLQFNEDGTVYDFGAAAPYNPADPNYGGSYLVTTKDGIAYSIDGLTGQLAEVSDANNNTLTFSDSGIISSTGKSVTFERDAQGRIAAVVDPMGQRISYQYDAKGDLTAVTDRSNNTTQFVYRSTPEHYLDQVIDPLGRTGVRADYDAQGRLTKVIDAAGNPVQFTYDPTHSLETVTDQNGNPTTYEYDDRGNIVKEIDPLGAVTLRTFDADSNMLTETDPLGRTTTYTYDDRADQLTQTDPLGNTTISTYQAFTFGVGALAASEGRAAPPFTRQTTSTDPLGDTTHISYDFFGDVAAESDARGYTTTMPSDSAGNPTVITDPLGNVTTNQYDGAGDRTRLIDADGHVTNFTYDANGNLLSQTQADGSGWSQTYNADGLPTNVGPIGLPHTVQYNALNQITQLTEPSGETGTLSYDALGHLTQVTLPDGTTAASNTYDAMGNIVAVTDSLGNLIHFTYDADNQLIQTTYPDGSTEKRTYDLAGELVAVTDALGNITHYVYDADGRQIQTIDALGGVSSTQYDAADNIVATTDPLGRTTRFQYDADGNLIETIASDGSTIRNVYDADDQLVQTIDAAGNVTTDGYDPAGNLVSVTDALSNVTSYQYNDDGGKAAMTDAKGNVMRYSYDAQGHLIQTTLPDGETSSSTYNSVGQLASTTNGDGQTIQYGYNLRGEQTSLTLPDGSQETFTYTSDGLISSVTDASGTTTYDYDPVTRLLVRMTEPDGRYIRYEYDTLGQRTLMAASLGAGQPEEVTQYAYDALGRLVQVTDPQGGVTTYTYDADGNLLTTTLPNGVTETDTYDTQNRLIAIVDTNAAGATIGGFAYTLDANGNRTKEVDADGSYILYTYDALNRVIEEQHFNSSGQLAGFETYTYDALGNVAARSGTLLGNATFSYNGDNQLVTGDGSTYAYDAAGNLVSVTDSTGAVTRYSYDAQGRLISSQTPDGATTTYTYDFQGVRQSQQGPNGLVKYLVDEANGPSSAQVILESDATGATLRSYVIGDGLISIAEGGNVRYYLTDVLSSTRLLSDPTGVVTDMYSYSAYGKMLVHTGSSDNSFLFAGQDQDGSSGLVYLRARYYDPNTGRFLSRDAFPGSDQLPLSLNKYLYALANPVNNTDPSGNQTLMDEEEAEAVDGEIDAIEAESDSGTVRQGIRLIERSVQAVAAVETMFAGFEGLSDPGNFSGFFGGLFIPVKVISKIPIIGNITSVAIGVAAELYLAKITYKLATSTITYLPDPTKSAIAYVRRVGKVVEPPNTIFINPTKFFKYPFEPSLDAPLAYCQIGILIHEFAHFTWPGVIIDQKSFFTGGKKAYGGISLTRLPPWQALRNADNYRIATQAVFADLTPEEAAKEVNKAPTSGTVD